MGRFNINIALLFVVLSLMSMRVLEAVPCTGSTTFHWSSNVVRWNGNDVWSFGSGFVDGVYMWYWRPRVTSTSRLNGAVLLGRLNVVNTANYGGEAINQWHDAPQSTGTGTYTIANLIEYLPDPPCDSISPMNNTENLIVSRPYITGVSGAWWLGGGNDSANGYHNQALLTANKNCSAGYNCSVVPHWTVTANPQKIDLDCSVCTDNVVTTAQRSDSLGDVTIKFDINGFESSPFAFTVNAPYRMISWSPYVQDSAYNDGWWSYIYYRNADRFGWAMSSIALNEQFGSFINDQVNNWAKPTAAGISGYSGYEWVDNMFIHSCPTCSPSLQNPLTPLGNSAVDHATQSWRLGSSTVGSGVVVQTNTHQRYRDHGRHTSITSPVN